MLSPKYLEENFRTVRKNTIVVAEEIPADKYSFIAAPGVKSVGEMLAHVAVSPRWQIDLHTEGVRAVDFPLFAARLAKARADEQALRTKEQIVSALKDGGEQFAAFLAGMSAARLEADDLVPAPDPAGGEDPHGDAAGGQGARDAPSRAADARRAHARHRPAPDPPT